MGAPRQNGILRRGVCLLAALAGGCVAGAESDEDWMEVAPGEDIGTADSEVQAGVYSIIATHSGKCLDIRGASLADKAALDQYSCHHGPNQRFQILDLGNGEWAIVAQHSDKCLDVPGVTTANTVQLEQYTCHLGPNQRFRFVSLGGGHYAITAKHSGKCLDVRGASLADTVPVDQYTCHFGPNQRFRLQ